MVVIIRFLHVFNMEKGGLLICKICTLFNNIKDIMKIYNIEVLFI